MEILNVSKHAKSNTYQSTYGVHALTHTESTKYIYQHTNQATLYKITVIYSKFQIFKVILYS